MSFQDGRKNQHWGGDRRVLVLTRFLCSVGKGWRWCLSPGGPGGLEARCSSCSFQMKGWAFRLPEAPSPAGVLAALGMTIFLEGVSLSSSPSSCGPSLTLATGPPEPGSAMLSLFRPRCCLGWESGSAATVEPAASLPLPRPVLADPLTPPAFPAQVL